MSTEHDNHGRTPANWTGATIITLAFIVGTLGVVLAQPIVFWIGVLHDPHRPDRLEGHGGHGVQLRRGLT